MYPLIPQACWHHAAVPAARRGVKGMAIVLALGIGAKAFADAPEWSDIPYDYVILDQDVRLTLTEFGRNLDIAVSLTDAVKGRVIGQITAKTAEEFLQRLSEQNGLTWYFDGSVLHVSAASEYVTRLVPASGHGSADIIGGMQELGLADERFSIRSAGDGSMISVSGPPAYIATVEQYLNGIQPRRTASGDDPRVRVYRGGLGSEEVATAAPDNQP